MAAILMSIPTRSTAAQRDYTFDGTLSRAVLENYLSRAVTHSGLCASCPDRTTACVDDDIRMLTGLGAKFIGRAAFAWELPPDEDAHFALVKATAEKVHAADPDMVLQACVFEIVTTAVEKVPVPAWVFEAFGLPVAARSFDYEAMLYDKERGKNRWRRGASVPDMSKLETRLWFYYRSRRYIDCGIEAIHFGQVMIMDDADPGHRHWIDMLTRVRAHAKTHARRHLVLCDAHTPGEVEDGRLLFDFHSFPLRIAEVKGKPQQAMLSPTFADNIYNRSKGGVTPSGWTCASLPYLVEFDNWGYTGKGGRSVGGCWVWGYDEISWFAHQDAAYRDQWLRYAFAWVKKQDPNGHLQMPSRRVLAAPTDGGKCRMYHANRKSDACPYGFGDEKTTRDIWRRNP